MSIKINAVNVKNFNLNTDKLSNSAALLAAWLVPCLYLLLYTPYSMDTTDFGYFYAYGWRILEGQMPYRDFYYIKPALPLYWHAFWLWLTPAQWQILAGKAGFLCTLLASSWFGSLFINKIFNLHKLRLPLSLLATTGFMFSIHSFPHMPWHTADGVLFSACALWTAAMGWTAPAGILAACAMLCKKSFLFVPAGIALFLYFYSAKKTSCLIFILSWLTAIAAALAFIYLNGAWTNFRAMTTGQLAIAEALDAGIYIYLRQNWLLPLIAILPWLFLKLTGKISQNWLLPCYLYLPVLTFWYIYQVLDQKTWIGYGASWPTLFMLLGGLCVLLPGKFLKPWLQPVSRPHPLLTAAIALAAALVASWSVAISGGYKIPTFFAVPLLFSFYLVHARFGGDCRNLAWLALGCALLMFNIGYQYPYVFPVRPLTKSELNLDAGQIYSQASGVKVDKDMFERLLELKYLRAKYGANYKTLPGFSFAYYLNGDKPVYSSDWLIDWEINGDIDKLYDELLRKNITVFMERDQLDTKKADAYERAGYAVPQKVRKLWRIVEETPHFVVFKPPQN